MTTIPLHITSTTPTHKPRKQCACCKSSGRWQWVTLAGVEDGELWIVTQLQCAACCRHGESEAVRLDMWFVMWLVRGIGEQSKKPLQLELWEAA